MEDELIEPVIYVNTKIDTLLEYGNYALYAVLFGLVLYLTYRKLKEYYKLKRKEEEEEHNSFKS